MKQWREKGKTDRKAGRRGPEWQVGSGSTTWFGAFLTNGDPTLCGTHCSSWANNQHKTQGWKEEVETVSEHQLWTRVETWVCVSVHLPPLLIDYLRPALVCSLLYLVIIKGSGRADVLPSFCGHGNHGSAGSEVLETRPQASEECSWTWTKIILPVCFLMFLAVPFLLSLFLIYGYQENPSA